MLAVNPVTKRKFKPLVVPLSSIFFKQLPQIAFLSIVVQLMTVGCEQKNLLGPIEAVEYLPSSKVARNPKFFEDRLVAVTGYLDTIRGYLVVMPKPDDYVEAIYIQTESKAYQNDLLSRVGRVVTLAGKISFDAECFRAGALCTDMAGVVWLSDSNLIN